jgi:hypothetical protein
MMRACRLIGGVLALLAASCGSSPLGGFPDAGTPDTAAGPGPSDGSGSSSGGMFNLGDSEAGAGTTCAEAQAYQSSVGCDYYSFVPDVNGSTATDDCFAVMVANTQPSPVTIKVDYGGTLLDDYPAYILSPMGSGTALTYANLGGDGNLLDPGHVALLFLSGACPATAFVSLDASTHGGLGPPADASMTGTGIGKAFHVSTDRPVVAYDIFPYGAADSAITAATLLIPTSAWGTNYVAVDAYSGLSNPNPPPNVPFVPWIAIVAQVDGTNVTLSPTAAIAGGTGVPGTGRGVPWSYALNKGQVLQIEQADGSELNGSPIQSDKPVALFGGINCMFVPGTAAACDSGHQQIPPVHALGHEYAYARYRDRNAGVPESPPVRVIGAVDGTNLVYDPSPPSGAPTTLAAHQTVDFTASGPFAVRSQDDGHPFYMAAYMTGCESYAPDPMKSCPGDPEFVNLVPPQQFLPEYVFFTDVTYPETELVVVRQKNAQGAFDDVELDCLTGPVSGWQPLGGAGTYEYARVDLVTGAFTKVGKCDNGVHEMHSSTPFGLTVWGWWDYVSYAYPAGMKVQSITPVVVPPTIQ